MPFKSHTRIRKASQTQLITPGPYSSTSSLTHSVPADDVLTSWGANPVTGIRDYRPPPSSVKSTTSSSPLNSLSSFDNQCWHQGIIQQWEFTAGGANAKGIPQQEPQRASSWDLQRRCKVLGEDVLAFTIYILLRALPAFRTLEHGDAGAIERIVAVSDVAVAFAYLFLLGHAMGLVLGGMLKLAGLATGLGDLIVVGGIGALLWFVREREENGDAQIKRGLPIQNNSLKKSSRR